MKKLLLISFLAFSLSGCFFATQKDLARLEKKIDMQLFQEAGADFRPFTCLEGGTAGCTDKPTSTETGDVGFVVLEDNATYGNSFFPYVLDEDGVAGDNLPFTIESADGGEDWELCKGIFADVWTFGSDTRIGADSAAYLKIVTANGGQTTISQVTDGTGVGTDDGIVLGASGDAVIHRVDGGTDTLCNGCYTGVVIEGINAGESIVQGVPVFLASDGKWDHAEADVAGEFPAWGIAVKCSDGNWPCDADDGLTVLVHGVYRDEDFTQWDTVGDVIYLGEDGTGITTGLVDEAGVPDTADDCVQSMGFVIEADHVYINVDPHWLLVE